ncbi:MAG: HAD-superfamily hydrolase, subfamily variant 3 [Candidatus Berkelbacteria bacterium]|nr:HAD-superfamily hydrolase, subfamily variant 3 [Candidatus Berkelbacteria bacterium]
MIKTIAFDFGGVLYTYNHSKLMSDVSGELNLPVELVSKAWKKGIIKFENGEISEEQFWQIFLNELEKKYDPKKLHEIVINHHQPIKGSLGVLEKLKGKVSLGLVSNQTDWIDDLDQKYHFKELFDMVIVSKEVFLRKPDKKIFQLLIGRSTAKANEIVFVDDSLEYGQVVKDVGLKFIHFRNPDQLESDLRKLNVIF